MMRGLWDRETVALMLLAAYMPLALFWLLYGGSDGQILRFDILLKQRPGHCLACNLTYGLPQVFSRHPVINIAGIVEQVDTLLQDKGSVGDWKLGSTRELGQSTHAIPLTIELRSE